VCLLFEHVINSFFFLNRTSSLRLWFVWSKGEALIWMYQV